MNEPCPLNCRFYLSLCKLSWHIISVFSIRYFDLLVRDSRPILTLSYLISDQDWLTLDFTYINIYLQTIVQVEEGSSLKLHTLLFSYPKEKTCAAYSHVTG